MLRFRRASYLDIESIMGLVLKLAAYEKCRDAVYVSTKTFRRDGFGTFPLFRCFLLEDTANDGSKTACLPGLAVWYIAYSTWEGPVMFLEDVFIEDSYRRRGVGTHLMYALTDIAISLGCRRIMWQTFDFNQVAKHLCKRLGAEIQKDQLTLRLTRESMVEFIKTRPAERTDPPTDKADDATKSTSFKNHGHVPRFDGRLDATSLESVIDKCLELSNAELKMNIKSQSFRIRRAEENDAKYILQFVEALAVFRKKSVAVHTTAENFARDGFGDNPLYQCLLLEETGANDGIPSLRGMTLWFIGYSSWEGRSLFLEEMFVDEEFRGRGAGKHFMYTLAEIAMTLDCGRFVWRALDWNTNALDFYQGIGAEIDRESLTVCFDWDKMEAFMKTREEKDDGTQCHCANCSHT